MVLLQILHLQLQFLQFILLHMNQLREPCFLFFLRYHPDLLLCKSLYYLVFVLSGTGSVHVLLHSLFYSTLFIYLFATLILMWKHGGEGENKSHTFWNLL